MFSPFEAARQHDGHFEEGEFEPTQDDIAVVGADEEPAQSQTGQSSQASEESKNVFGDSTKVSEGQTVIETEDGELVIIDEDGEPITQVQRVVIEQRDTSSPLSRNQGYLIICVVVLVALLIMILLVCLCRKCRQRDVKPQIAETIYRERDQKPIDEDFDTIEQRKGGAQYNPKANDLDLIGVVQGQATK